jgi:pimeloyl-ACP methyl ester carboxylesterase
MMSPASPWLNPEWRPPASAHAVVICVHGAVVNGEEMYVLRHRLRQLGYRVLQFKYQSMLRSLDYSVLRLREVIRETEGGIVHVIGHSMGGVLTRHAFEHSPDPRPGRLIAIGSPFLDCWVGRRLNRFHPHLGRYLVGRAVYDHISHPADPVWRGARDFGVLAGTYPFGIGAVFRSHPRPSDGVVLWDETRMEGLRDHVTFRLNHFGMLFSKRCCAQVARFLATGAFAHPAPAAPPRAEAVPARPSLSRP